MAVEELDVAYLGGAIGHRGDVPEPCEPSAGQHDLGLRQLQRGVGAAQDPDRLLAVAEVRPAAGQVDVEGVQLLVDLRAGSSSTRISRFTPPYRDTCATPGTVNSVLVMVSSTNQDSCRALMVVELTA